MDGGGETMTQTAQEWVNQLPKKIKVYICPDCGRRYPASGEGLKQPHWMTTKLCKCGGKVELKETSS